MRYEIPVNNAHKFKKQVVFSADAVTKKVDHGIHFLSKIVFKTYIMNTNKSIKISLLYGALDYLIWDTWPIYMEHIAYLGK